MPRHTPRHMPSPRSGPDGALGGGRAANGRSSGVSLNVLNRVSVGPRAAPSPSPPMAIPPLVPGMSSAEQCQRRPLRLFCQLVLKASHSSCDAPHTSAANAASSIASRARSDAGARSRCAARAAATRGPTCLARLYDRKSGQAVIAGTSKPSSSRQYWTLGPWRLPLTLHVHSPGNARVMVATSASEKPTAENASAMSRTAVDAREQLSAMGASLRAARASTTSCLSPSLL